jgi:hypothetical protein
LGLERLGWDEFGNTLSFAIYKIDATAVQVYVERKTLVIYTYENIPENRTCPYIHTYNTHTRSPT